MRFLFPEERLLGHPCVYKVDRWKLTLTCGFRIKKHFNSSIAHKVL